MGMLIHRHRVAQMAADEGVSAKPAKRRRRKDTAEPAATHNPESVPAATIEHNDAGSPVEVVEPPQDASTAEGDATPTVTADENAKHQPAKG